MDFELTPLTASGRHLVALAEQHAVDFAARADQHDREGSFPLENIEAMQRSSVMAACVPAELGGLGVESVHDAVLGINRLGRGDGSTAIAANMHIFLTWLLTRAWRAALAAGEARHTEPSAHVLRQIGTGQLVWCGLLSEPGTDLNHPLVEATKIGGGWLLRGRKIFGTLSPAAQLRQVSCRVKDTQDGFRRAWVSGARGSAGLDIRNNWDALGMRGSGSHDVVFQDCFVPDAALMEDGLWGAWTERLLSGNIVLTMGLVGAFLGIAEAARDGIVALVKTAAQGSQRPDAGRTPCDPAHHCGDRDRFSGGSRHARTHSDRSGSVL
jgi:L-evernosamine nitrososynthase